MATFILPQSLDPHAHGKSKTIAVAYGKDGSMPPEAGQEGAGAGKRKRGRTAKQPASKAVAAEAAATAKAQPVKVEADAVEEGAEEEGAAGPPRKAAKRAKVSQPLTAAGGNRRVGQASIQGKAAAGGGPAGVGKLSQAQARKAAVRQEPEVEEEEEQKQLDKAHESKHAHPLPSRRVHASETAAELALAQGESA